MAGTIKLTTALSITNPSAGGPTAFTGSDNPTQQTITQNTIGQSSDITSIPIATAGTVAQGTVAKPSALAATTTTLPANTYANGTLGVGATLTGNANGAFAAVDGITLVVGQYVLVKNEASGLKNGLYKLTTLGDGSNPYVLTRVTAMDTTGEFVGAVVYVESGTVNAAQNWNCTNATAPTVGTTAITFAQSAAGTAIAYGGVTTLGVLFVQNLDATNFVKWGPQVGGYMQPVGRIKAGENFTFRLDQNPTLVFLADTAACNVYYRLLSD